MKLPVVIALLAAGTALMPAVNAQSITVRVDTPEFGIRIGPGGALHAPVRLHPVPILAPVMVVAHPVVVHPAALPVNVFVPDAVVPVRAFYPQRRAHFLPPGHYRKHQRHWRHAERGDWRSQRDDD